MGLVIAGGYDPVFFGVADVDRTENGMTFEPMTPLPIYPARYPTYSCLASLDDERLLLTGGMSAGSSNGAYYDQALLYR